MGSRERRERAREELREKILDAARELFATNGVEATTMRMIADRIEYSATAIYSYFADKDALLLELCESDFSTLGQMMAGVMDVANPVERLQRIGNLYVEFAIKHPNHYRFLFMSRPRSNKESETLTMSERSYSFIRQAVESVLASGRVREEYRDPDLLTQLMWGSIHGIISLHLTMGHIDWIHWHSLTDTSRLLYAALHNGIGEPQPVLESV